MKLEFTLGFLLSQSKQEEKISFRGEIDDRWRLEPLHEQIKHLHGRLDVWSANVVPSATCSKQYEIFEHFKRLSEQIRGLQATTVANLQSAYLFETVYCKAITGDIKVEEYHPANLSFSETLAALYFSGNDRLPEKYLHLIGTPLAETILRQELLGAFHCKKTKQVGMSVLERFLADIKDAKNSDNYADANELLTEKLCDSLANFDVPAQKAFERAIQLLEAQTNIFYGMKYCESDLEVSLNAECANEDVLHDVLTRLYTQEFLKYSEIQAFTHAAFQTEVIQTGIEQLLRRFS